MRLRHTYSYRAAMVLGVLGVIIGTRGPQGCRVIGRQAANLPMAAGVRRLRLKATRAHRLR